MYRERVGWTSLKLTRGRLRAEPSLQLGTLSTRIANLLCIIHSALWRLSCRTAVVLRTAHTLGPGGPLPHADRHATRDRHDLPTSQPDNRTAAVFQYPAVSWELTPVKCVTRALDRARYTFAGETSAVCGMQSRLGGHTHTHTNERTPKCVKTIYTFCKLGI